MKDLNDEQLNDLYWSLVAALTSSTSSAEAKADVQKAMLTTLTEASDRGLVFEEAS